MFHVIILTYASSNLTTLVTGNTFYFTSKWQKKFEAVVTEMGVFRGESIKKHVVLAMTSSKKRHVLVRCVPQSGHGN